MCDKKMLKKLKCKMYRTVVRPWCRMLGGEKERGGVEYDRNEDVQVDSRSEQNG